jgi:hypothetical protein
MKNIPSECVKSFLNVKHIKRVRIVDFEESIGIAICIFKIFEATANTGVEIADTTIGTVEIV